ncbi:MAG: glutamine synthetase family protein [Oscillospiraceae bacterium]|jgi:glutamine synthetase|nr:glutamine synthetase family protein [Oscillospiraceae bacterium]
MTAAASEVLQFVSKNDVKFIRLAFCDLSGRQRNISIMPSELERAFEEGISFDAHAISGFSDTIHSDLYLFPDPNTISVLPWRPQQGRVIRFYCDIKDSEGQPFWGDARAILKSVVKKAEKSGYVCKVGAECEFYLFKTNENGEPTTTPFDNGGYLDVSPLDRCENIRREICLCLEEMEIKPESSHHEQGPGQNEIDFRFSDALSCADNLVTFKNVVKSISNRNGLFASFSPKPLPDRSGSGLHINLSLCKNGVNIFKNSCTEHSEEAESFIAGVLEKAPEITAFLNPIPNSYERFGAFEAPSYVSWSHGNRSQLVRIPQAKMEKVRMELRSADSSSNPYLAFALTINAGLYGIENKLKLPPAVNVDLCEADSSVTDGLVRLPENLREALKIAESSEFVKDTLTEQILSAFIAVKSEECDKYEQAEDKYGYFLSDYFLKL